MPDIISALRGQLTRGFTTYRNVGLKGLIARVLVRLDGGRGILSKQEQRYREHKAEVDARFDGAHGVSTGGVEYIHKLTIDGPNARYGTNHVASDPDEFDRAISAVPADRARFTFIDLGSGKGRALLLANRYEFKRIIGVEFAAELHDAATANIQAVVDQGSVSRIELVHGDATRFDFPNDPVIVFLFNPFTAKVVAEVAANLLKSWQQSPRPVYVLYVNPVHEEDWTQAGWRIVERGHPYAVLSPAE